MDRLVARAVRGEIVVRFRVRVTGRPASLLVQALDGQWATATTLRVGRTSVVRAAMKDEGYVAIRVLATPSGARAPSAASQARVPLPPPLFPRTAPPGVRQLPADAAASSASSVSEPGGAITIGRGRSTLAAGRLVSRIPLRVRGGAWRVAVERYLRGSWLPLSRSTTRRSRTLVVRRSDHGELGLRVRATLLSAQSASAERLVLLPPRPSPEG